ncbi:COBRA-like extracellular glycosyl-phosphatidyl inositol-anchored protein family [Klebsormidium nitens]|uniref:COBRA-like extracellular glycosyl-phosphatidyl inositol-anchored protein family n=1 Tax=Klebsormidium nitens TaxID=105231 RepID=A0A1Y1I3A2_KLENI|nr:COBRA-like extracellular glycosyl-phosphatidyl inositol-anchored protein family [Klebsormidium nitens]|eukprot:GAQ85415.1 COBRA-like extracellular glycosyl-phosphatidyl inositol-anchored protein family [Klebsormidium nitens]
MAIRSRLPCGLLLLGASLLCLLRIAAGASPQFCTAGTYTIQVQYTMTYPDTSPIESAAISNWWRFTSTIAMKNIGTRNLTNWALKVGFNVDEYVTAVDGASSTPLYPAYGASMTFLPPTWAPYLPTSTAVNGDTNKYYQYITISGTRIGSAATTSMFPSSLTLTAYGITCGSGTQSGSSYWLCCNEIANPPTGAPTPAPIQATSCNGVLADYIYDGDKSFPGGGTTTYSFNSRLVLSNVGTQHVYKWAAYFNFVNNENITSVANAAASPSVFPVSGNNLAISSPPWQSDLPTSLEAAGDTNKYEIQVPLTGARFGKPSGIGVLPSAMTLFFNAHPCIAKGQATSYLGDTRLRMCCAVSPPSPPSSATPGSSVNGTNATSVATGPCTGVVIDYAVNTVSMIPPVADPQPFRFEATATMQNIGSKTLKNWQLQIGYQLNEIITTVSGADIDSPLGLPAQGNTTLFNAPISTPNLPNSIDVAGDITQYIRSVSIVGTEFGAADEGDALPASLTIVDPSYLCRPGTYPSGTTNRLRVCCDERTTPLAPAPAPSALDQPLDALGVIQITWDVITSETSQYTAQVTVANNQRYRSVDSYPKGPGWALSWIWTMGEFIWSMNGAQATLVGDCARSSNAKTYGDSINLAHSCVTAPTIVDLPPDQIYAAGVANCCKNGSLSALAIDKTKNTAMFTMKVGKNLANFDRLSVVAPHNFTINQPGYICTRAKIITPTVFQINSQRSGQAFLTWSIQCYQAPTYVPPVSCCVSFSAFFNKTLAPCATCACGCNASTLAAGTCDPTAIVSPEPVSSNPYILAVDPTDAVNSLLAATNTSVINTLPVLPACSDGCPVNFHWHIQQDFLGGWSAKMVMLNRGSSPVKDWYAVVQHPGFANFSTAYSVEFTPDLVYNMLFQGYPSYNDWLLGVDKKGTPGNIQSVLLFGKNPGFEPRTMGFPTRVLLNGYECAMPQFAPTSAGHRPWVSVTVAVLAGLATVALCI